METKYPIIAIEVTAPRYVHPDYKISLVDKSGKRQHFVVNDMELQDIASYIKFNATPLYAKVNCKK